MIRIVGWLLGIDQATSIDGVGLKFAAPWAQGGLFWVFLLVCAVAAGALVFYARLQPGARRGPRWALGAARGALLALLVATLCDPVLELALVKSQRPLIYVVIDGSESMTIQDELPRGERTAIERAVDYRPSATGATRAARIDYVRALLRKPGENPFARLAAAHGADLEFFVFEGNTTSRLRRLAAARGNERGMRLGPVAEQLSASGQVTALGSALDEISQQFSSRRLAAVVLVSDFAHNAGPFPLGGPDGSAAKRLAVPIYTVGVGASEAIDLAVDLQTDLKLKKAERSNIQVQLRQSGLTGQTADVRVTGKKLGGEAGAAAEILVGQRTIRLDSPLQTADFPITPEDSGPFEFVATAQRLEAEAVVENNQAQRQVNVIDDYLRLIYVAHEPTWEWRFVKEVFHRDKLVGMPGFRTYLGSSDPRVRESNVLFLPTLTPKRSEFFASDVLFLDDMPRQELSDRFCEMTKEYVSDLSGGLVVIAGPRFGPRELYQTSIADMLPVVLDASAEMRSAPEQPEFRPRVTSHAERYLFMQLGADAAESRRAWENLGKLPWYQPVSMPHPQAEVLLEHPTDKCADGKTPQPLIAVRKYGKGGAGEVVWLGFNEMWRLRRGYGEKYYRQFWSQLIYRLGMSHALGAEKRFVARLDRQQYRSGEQATLSVEAYDENYEPLGDRGLPKLGLQAELISPGGGGSQSQPLIVPMLRKGVFEVRIPVFAVGSYGIRVNDPVTGKTSEQRFEVTGISAEKSRPVRDGKLQAELAEATGGRSYDLATIHRLPGDAQIKPIVERVTRHGALWTTPIWFGAIVALMLGEWAARKVIRLP